MSKSEGALLLPAECTICKEYRLYIIEHVEQVNCKLHLLHSIVKDVTDLIGESLTFAIILTSLAQFLDKRVMSR